MVTVPLLRAHVAAHFDAAVALNARANVEASTRTRPVRPQVLGICTAPARELVLTEFCPRGSVDGLYNATSLSLSDDHNPIARPLQWRIAHELAQALRFMHDAGVMHRDVKGANVLLTQGRHVKLADFDLATRDATSTHTLGTPGYMAPEVMAAAETGAPYDRGCDVFAFGGVLFELSHNLPPFYIAPEGRPFEAYWEALKREVWAGAPARAPAPVPLWVGSAGGGGGGEWGGGA